MVSQGLKELVRGLFADREFLQSFLNSPEGVLVNRGVPTEERRALLRLRTRLAAAGASEMPFVGPDGEWP